MNNLISVFIYVNLEFQIVCYQSRIGYAISAWMGFASQGDIVNIDKLQKIINKATR